MALAACLLVQPFVAAATVTRFDFEDATGFVVQANYVRDGFRFSPACHYDAVPGGPSGTWLGWDLAGCLTGAPDEGNPQWLGPPQQRGASLLYIDHAGMDFSVLSVEPSAPGMTFTSSRGGSVTVAPVLGQEPFTRVLFTGPLWRDILWLTITGGGGAPQGIDNLVLQYDEGGAGNGTVGTPATLALSLLALAAAAAAGTRRRC